MKRVQSRKKKFEYKDRPIGHWIRRLTSAARQFEEVTNLIMPLLQKGIWPMWHVKLFAEKHAIPYDYMEECMLRLGAIPYEDELYGVFWDLRDLHGLRVIPDPNVNLDHSASHTKEEV